MNHSLLFTVPPPLPQIQSGRFKTGLCPALGRPEGCPRGDKCTYAHSEEERDVYRSLPKGPKPTKVRTEPVKMPGGGSRGSQGGSRGHHSGDFGPPISDHTLYTYLPSQQQTPSSVLRAEYIRQSSGEGSFEAQQLPPGSYSFTTGECMHVCVYCWVIMTAIHSLVSACTCVCTAGL